MNDWCWVDSSTKAGLPPPAGHDTRREAAPQALLKSEKALGGGRRGVLWSRSGRKKFVPTPDQRNAVRLLVRQGIPQEYIRRAILNPQTGKPLSIKTLELALRPEIETGTTELHTLVGDFIISAILGKKPT